MKFFTKPEYFSTDPRYKWNYMRFLTEFHSMFDAVNDANGRVLFHDNVYSETHDTNKLYWDLDGESVLMCDEHCVYWWPGVVVEDCHMNWEVVDDHAAEAIFKAIVHNVIEMGKEEFAEKVHNKKLSLIDAEIEAKSKELLQLKNRRTEIVSEATAAKLEQKYLNKWILDETTGDLHFIKEIRKQVGASSDLIFVSTVLSISGYGYTSSQADEMQLTACPRTTVKLQDLAKVKIISDPTPFIQNICTNVEHWLTQYIKDIKKTRG